MKTPIELKKLYKEETGNPFINVEYSLNEISDVNEWDSLTISEYVEWLEEKLINTQKQMDQIKILHNYKEDYEDALYRIDQLEDELENAEVEISELQEAINH